MLCSSLAATNAEAEVENNNSTGNQKKEMICKAIRSLIEIYRGRKHHAIAEKFEKLENCMR